MKANATPWEWVQTVLQPQLAKKFDLTTREGKEKAAVAISQIFTDRTAADIVVRMLTQAAPRP